MEEQMNEMISLFTLRVNSITKNVYIKLLIITILFLCFSTTTWAQRKISEKEYESNYANKYELRDNNIVIQTILDFPGMNKEELYKRAKDYLDDRIQKKYTAESTNTDYSYTNYSLIITEEKNNFLWIKTILGPFYAVVKYIYKLEVKDNRIRATIIVFSIKQPEYNIEFKDIFPFTNKLKSKMRRVIADFVDYSDELFTHTQKGIEAPQIKTDDNW